MIWRPAFVAELIPTAVRTTGTSLSYGLGAALLGGTAPLVATVFIGMGADWLVPWCVVVVAVLGLVAALRSPESAFGSFGEP